MSKFFKALEQAERDGADQVPQAPVEAVSQRPSVMTRWPEPAREEPPRAPSPVDEPTTPPAESPRPVFEPPRPVFKSPRPVVQSPRVASALLDEHLVSLQAPSTAAAEQYRVLRHLVETLRKRTNLQILAVTSPGVGDGKSVTAINLAGALAQSPDARVLLADMDLRRPAVVSSKPYRGGLLMRSVTYSMSASLDGYIVGPDGRFDWTVPDAEVFRFWIDEIREVGVHLMGRRLYETMLYWETADQNPSLDDAELEWAALWKPLPKVVFSTTLSAVQGNARLASGGLAEEIERLRAEPGDGDIAIGGATLAAEAAALGLIDEYRVMVYPVLVGGGIPYFPQRERRVDLELVETRTFSSSVVYLRYRVAR